MGLSAVAGLSCLFVVSVRDAGLGGTKFISFDERHWHSECFVCYRCNTSLVGRGFLTDGAEVLCPDCGRA